MTTQPTPEQIEAARRWTRLSVNAPITKADHDALQAYADANRGVPGLHYCSDAPPYILLAALERAEQDSARLDWLEKNKETSYNPPVLSRVTLGWPLGTSLRDAIDAAASAQLDVGLSNAARKAQP